MEKIDDELQKLDNLMIKYISALKVLETQLQIINDDFKYIKKYNPIEHIKTRIKSADSIINKLYKDNLDFTIENVEKYINDIVGVRIICSFESDVFELIEIIRNSNIIHVINEKDFISKPKDSGYRSYHLIVEVPVEFINEKVMVKAEIQIRTMAMDLWASLDHKLRYKSNYCTDEIKTKLVKISDELHNIDDEMRDMVTLENKIKLLNEGED
ncbi:MAG TPA: GTP pyrophosphokinase family protein [Candidatus Coprovivens excrementavium]|nr:GTP pyrophosphokinase family protein [Candidatus Coprovivens excrementavium]